mmetsp:Transcript_21119/g.42572  ORF Transcript_21119/g.42572 Transcript_21119/m.42572 type:complete len:314 (-) Transcript_21119:150-1091(-)
MGPMATAAAVASALLLLFPSVAGHLVNSNATSLVHSPPPSAHELRRLEDEFRANRALLKEEYYHRTRGGTLTDEDIDAALANATVNVVFTRPIPGYEDYYQEYKEAEASFAARGGRRRLQVGVVNPSHILISLYSPGWLHNFGRNEYYCIGIDKINTKTKMPWKRNKLTMLPCEQPSILEQIGLIYDTRFTTIEFAIQSSDIWWPWLITVNNPRSGKLFAAKEDLEDPLQLWDILAADRTIRPVTQARSDVPTCVQAKPPRSAKQGGGQLKLAKCAADGRKRQAQTFHLCSLNSRCDFDEFGFLECDITAQCR